MLELLINLTIYGSVHELFDNYRLLELFENYCLNIHICVSEDSVYVIIMSLFQYMYLIYVFVHVTVKSLVSIKRKDKKQNMKQSYSH